jgi:hypothetical protein
VPLDGDGFVGGTLTCACEEYLEWYWACWLAARGDYGNCAWTGNDYSKDHHPWDHLPPPLDRHNDVRTLWAALLLQVQEKEWIPDVSGS